MHNQILQSLRPPGAAAPAPSMGSTGAGGLGNSLFPPDRQSALSRIALVNQSKRLELLQAQNAEQQRQEALRQKKKQMEIQLKIASMVKANAEAPLQLSVGESCFAHTHVTRCVACVRAACVFCIMVNTCWIWIDV